MIKNQYVLFVVALLAIASTALNVALFVSERGNEHRLRELNRRIDQMEFKQLPHLEERLSQLDPTQAVENLSPQSEPETESAGSGTAQ
ncbi:MAG: hypothetical protein HC808_11590 [Candidatus Competibacteraceae bacterium]|nr:hypothetical protein [Candidatus Competibacteraceae bacterium]